MSAPTTITDPTMSPAKLQVSQGLTLQGYCNSVLQQSDVDFGSFANLKQYQTQINSGLATAKGHANNYLNVIQPAVIKNLSDIGNYYQLFSAVPVACPPGSSEEQWLKMLNALQTQANTYQQTSSGIVTNLSTLVTDLGTDVGNFSTTVSNLNSAVNGDNGVLNDIAGQLSKLDGQIAGCIAGTVLSALAIAGGVFLIAVGGITDFITAGASTPLVIGGVAVLAAGVAGEATSAVLLSNFYKQKASLLTQKSTLTSEVNTALGASTAYGHLKDQASSAMDAATQMKSAWTSLSADLGNMSSDLQQGILNTDSIRTLFLTAANQLVPTITADIATIKSQMAGVQQVNLPASQPGGDSQVLVNYLNKVANNKGLLLAA